MASTADELHAKLDAFWESIAPLRPASTDAEYQKMASFIAPDAKLWFNGVNAPVTIGPAGAVEALKTMTTFWSIEERRVLTRATSTDGKTIIAEMDNRLVLGGLPTDLNEVEIVTFNDEGLIQTYRLHVDLEPAKAALAKAAEAKAGSS